MTMFMGWYDPDKTYSTTKKIGDGVQRYRAKCGKDPTVCLVNPSQFDQIEPGMVDTIQVRSSQAVAVNTFYLGRDDDA